MKFIGIAMVVVGIGLLVFIYSTPVTAGQSYVQTIVNDLKQFLQGNTNVPTNPTASNPPTTPTIASSNGLAPTLPSSMTSPTV